MPRRRRPVRQVRRPNFQPAPDAPSEDGESEDEAPPTFADEPAVAVPGYAGPGPVDTRPYRNASSERAQGRRLAQLRRSSGEERGIRPTSSGMLPAFAVGYISGEIRRILLTTAAMSILLLVLALTLR